VGVLFFCDSYPEGVPVMRIYVPFAWPEGQDQKYFPLGTSKAKSGLETAIRKENEKFRNGLIKMLGSEQAADAYIKRRRQAIRG
jgi:hypothetical protein